MAAVRASGTQLELTRLTATAPSRSSSAPHWWQARGKGTDQSLKRFLILGLILAGVLSHPAAIAEDAKSASALTVSGQPNETQRTVSELIRGLDSDTPATRKRSGDRLRDLWRDASSSEKHGFQSQLLRATSDATFELRAAVDEWITQSSAHSWQHGLHHWAKFGIDESLTTLELASAWNLFSERSGRTLQDRLAFAESILFLGDDPTGFANWWSDRQRNAMHALQVPWMDNTRAAGIPTCLLLGLSLPQSPLRSSPYSEATFGFLTRAAAPVQLSNTVEDHRPIARRLVTRFLLENPVHWTAGKRLTIARFWNMPAVSVDIALEVLAENKTPTQDVGLALLMLGQNTDTTVDAERCITSFLCDERLWTRSPFENTQGRIVGPRTRTRICDMAALALLARQERDPRAYGMPQIRADFIWGFQPESVCFDTEQTRRQTISMLYKSTPD
ncbi:MAG: hypothetical protein AAGD07_21565 [Planctomycetota bacterium]